MKIDAAEYFDGWLKLKVLPEPPVFRFLRTFKSGEYTITPEVKKRSTEQNKLLWRLCSEMATLLGTDNESVYKEEVRRYGVSEVVTMRPEAVKSFSRTWSRNGIAYFTEIYDNLGEQISLVCYSGSHDYDTKQMTRLINGIIEDAKELGIETLSERELAILRGDEK